MKYGILKFSLREKINSKGIRFISFPDNQTHVVNSKSPSKIDRWAKVTDDFELMELLGPVGHKETESKVLHYSMNIKPCKYPSYTLTQSHVQSEIYQSTIYDVFSVDNEDTRDIDDALSISINSNIITIGIHITDVATVFQNCMNDEDVQSMLEFAMKRASSTYTDIENTPMLPPHLTYNTLSLVHNKVRHAITLWLEYEDGVLKSHHFEKTQVKNTLATDYDKFKTHEHYDILSTLSQQSEPKDIIAWTMMTYNKYFAQSYKDILLRHQNGDTLAQYSHASEQLTHDHFGCLYTHATSPIRRYADLYNQLCWHNVTQDMTQSIDISTLNEASLNVKYFHTKHSIIDLSYACRQSAMKAIITTHKDGLVRVICDNKSYTVPIHDSFYEGEFIPNTECYIWGILKNGMSTLRIKSTNGDEETQTSEFKNTSQSPIDDSCSSNKKENTDTQLSFDKEDVEALLNHPLDKFQNDCYIVIDSGDDLFGSAPTGSGKTGVAMTAIYRAFHNNKRAIYTSPIKSLSNEKYSDFRSKLDGRVSLLTGDIKLRCSPPGGDGASELIVMTAEILRNKLYSKTLDPDLQEVSVVIIDECHYINDTDRGTVWEETFMHLPKNIQIVALSATLDKPDKFCSWLNKRRPTQLVQRFDRHVPLYFGNVKISSKKNQLVLMDSKDSKTYVWNVENEKPSMSRLTRSLIELELCPAIIFCMGRKRCVTHAESITDNLVLPTRPFKPNESASQAEHDAYELELKEYNDIVVNYKRNFDSFYKKYLGKFRKQLECIHGYDSFITMLQKGVAYHHAAMIPILREFVEVLFREKLIMVVFATETLGCGIDMPARTVVFSELEKPCGDQMKRLLKTEEFMQMAGRAGRRGRDVKGYVLYYSCNNVKIPYSTFANLALGNPPQATSQLQITPDLVLRNFHSGINTINQSLLHKELIDELQQTEQEYTKVKYIDDEHLERIIELNSKVIGDGFIKLNPKQMKNTKAEIKKLLGEYTIEQAQEQWKLYNTLQYCKSTVNYSWSQSMDYLYKNDFINDDNCLNRKGVIASHMCDGHPLVRAYILDHIDCYLSIEILASWLALFAGGPPIKSYGLKIPKELQYIVKESCRATEYYYEENLDKGIAYIMYDWMIHRDVKRILQFTNLSSFGSFIKVVLRVSSFIEETKTILLGLEKYEEYNKLENYEEKLFCGIVGNDSIHV